jgi:hypothetical protein
MNFEGNVIFTILKAWKYDFFISDDVDKEVKFVGNDFSVTKSRIECKEDINTPICFILSVEPYNKRHLSIFFLTVAFKIIIKHKINK